MNLNGRNTLSVGLELIDHGDDIEGPEIGNDLKSFASSHSFSFGLLPLRTSKSVQSQFKGPFQPQEMTLTTQDDPSFFVGCISNGLNPCSMDSLVRSVSEMTIKQEIQWATFIGISVIMLPPPSAIYDEDFSAKFAANYARCVNMALAMYHGQVWIRIPLGLEPEKENCINPWEIWNLIRAQCHQHCRLKVAIELNQFTDSFAQWLSEPVACIIIPTKTFISNKKGFPVLKTAHQALVKRFVEFGAQLAVGAHSKTEKLYPSGSIVSYLQYLVHLSSMLPDLNAEEQLVESYNDYLQAPLQPLMDHLESATYEVFEQDPVKYEQYEKAGAVYHALLDRPENHSTVIMVVGAGRGPLVSNCLAAAKNAKRMVKVYAIEKNPSAVVVLREKNHRIWNDAVTIVHTDMRCWNAPEKADILVSELLGSFGDNELSPECLDGAQKLLKEGGISIPSSYTSYIAPISSSKLHHEVIQISGITAAKTEVSVKPWETSYVVKIKRAVNLAEPKPLFTFRHPNNEPTADIIPGSPSFNIHNTRYDVKSFEMITEGAVLHGFVGYFDAILYKDVHLSILPATHSPGMYSWFPIFFPLKTPIFVTKNIIVDIHVWRLTDANKVWYEWSVVPTLNKAIIAGGSSGIHNPGGRSSWIGLH